MLRYCIITIFLVIIFSFIVLLLNPEDNKITEFVKPTNILLILIDALRPDHLSCYGYPKETSPNIDSLAKEGILFTQAISQANSTLPSIASILTSAYPNILNIRDWGDFLNPSTPTLAELLRKNGYYAGVFFAYSNFYRKSGLDQEFDTVGIGNGLKADGITAQARDWIRENQYKKFFLLLHYFDVHGTQMPMPFGHIPGYDESIRFVDEQIAIFLDELDELKLTDKTLIIITADHGEALGEHNEWFEHKGLYEEILRVPLIIKYNNLTPIVINSQVRLIDIMPTIFDILGIQYNKKMEGISLLPLMQGKRKCSKATFAFSVYPNGKQYSIRTNFYKLIYFENVDKYELYNLKDDPRELVNIVAMKKDIFIFLKIILNRWMRRTSAIIKKEKIILDEETKQQLRSLGYMQ